MPMGLAVADMSAGTHLVQGILSALVRRGITGQGSHVQVSLLESILDFQSLELTTYLNDGGCLPSRSERGNAHPYMAAPYGIYRTKDGFMALGRGSVFELGQLLNCEPLLQYVDPSSWTIQRDEIKRIIGDHLASEDTRSLLALLEPAGYGCSDVLNWDQLAQHEAFQALNMVQEVTRSNGTAMLTTRCPIRIDGLSFTSAKASPRIGEHNSTIGEELLKYRKDS